MRLYEWQVCGYRLFSVLLWVLLARWTCRSPRWAFVAFGISTAAINVVRLGGQALGFSLAHLGDVEVVLLFAILVTWVIMGLFCAMVMVQRKTKPTEVVAAPNEFEKRCADFARDHGLSPRETEILQRYAVGWSAARIAEAEGISEGTVKTHLKHIRKKTGVHGRRDLIAVIRGGA